MEITKELLKQKFEEYNKLYFNNELPMCTFSCAQGVVGPWDDSSLCAFYRWCILRWFFLSWTPFCSTSKAHQKRTWFRDTNNLSRLAFPQREAQHQSLTQSHHILKKQSPFILVSVSNSWKMRCRTKIFSKMFVILNIIYYFCIQ